jgi:hypothetical protein
VINTQVACKILKKDNSLQGVTYWSEHARFGDVENLDPMRAGNNTHTRI